MQLLLPVLAQLSSTILVIVAIACAFFKADDLGFSAMFWIRTLFKKSEKRIRRFPALTMERLLARRQQRIAIFVPCWHEADVVGRMIEYARSNIRYDNYEIFVGVYPNDPETIAAVREAAAKYERVHMVVNDRPGPTTKAQNLNRVYRYMSAREGRNPFSVVLLHDVEDVIHPLSLLVYNYLIPGKDMVQLPVLPLEREWNQWVAWTYADEFAVHHMKDMIVRESIGSFVPCAGVGCAFKREALDKLFVNDGMMFPEGSLTEDYLTALRLHRRGLKTIFVHQRMGARRMKETKMAHAYIATRAYFPDTLKTAIRQKTRWVSGIALQSWQHIGWTGDASTRYSLYRDRKSTISNVVPLLGYLGIALGVIVALLHLCFPRIALHVGGLAPQVVRIVVALTLLDLLQTAAIVTWVYGPLHGLLSVVRTPIGAYINGVATLRACVAFAKSVFFGRPMTWAKTAHVFPTLPPATSGAAERGAA